MSRSSIASPGERRGGFTFVELMVVIGIIALLVALLLATLGRASEASRRVKCLSNLRQITIATLRYAGDNRSEMPGAAQLTILPYDWIAWQRHKDPITGVITGAPQQNITHSALTWYLSSRFLATSNDDAANAADPRLDEVMRCPSDNLESRPSHNVLGYYYRYSYAMNIAWANTEEGRVYTFPKTSGQPGSFKVGQRVDGVFNGKLSSIHLPSEKVLFICEDEKTLDDGAFIPDAYAFVANSRTDVVSSRHDTHARRASSVMFPNEGNEDANGNAAFADGHAEYITRKDALRARHSGNPNPDPPGF